MSVKLRQSTASQEIPLGTFVDSVDGDTEETGLTIANTDIKLWKAGATTLANKNSGGATHISNGVYYCTLDATDTDTLGAMIVFVHVAGALAVRVECEVLAANVYDALVAGSDMLQVDTEQWKDATAPAMTGDAFARLGAPAGASIAADLATIDDFLDTEVAAIKAKTDALPADPADASDVAALISAVQADTNDIQTRLPAALVGGRMDANVGAVSGSSTAADNLEDGALAVVRGQAAAGTLTTTQFTTNLTEATDDHYNGRTVVWITGVLAGQAATVSDYDGAAKRITVAAMTDAPSAADQFVIV